jgi:hypothetical protein
MRKIFCSLALASIFLLVLANVGSAQLADLKVGKGDLKIGTILQARYHHSMAEDSTAVNGQFTMNRARILLWGTMVPDKVDYFFQTEMNQNVSILDFKMILTDLIPQSTLTIGRFLPNYTIYMPEHKGKLDMIHHPLHLAEYGIWRQTGVQLDSKTEFVDITAGLFNGPVNNTADNNDAKAILLRGGFKPEVEFGEVVVGGFAWLDNLLLTDDGDLSSKHFGFFGTVNAEKFEFNGELIMGRDEQATAGADDMKSMGYMFHGEYKARPDVGILGRYDFLDQNTDHDDDAMTRITFGLNHYIESYHAMIYINYLHNMEQGDNDVKNDSIEVQFQVAI